MNRHLTWTLIAAFALGACGASDRPQEGEPAIDPATTAPPPMPAEPTPEAPPIAEADQAGAGEGTSAEDEAAPTTPTGIDTESDRSMIQPSERLYTVQIAAYLSPDSATALAGKLAARGLPVWTMEVRSGDNTYHRIRVGAHPRLVEARRLGERISAQFRQEVWVAPVDMSSRIPADAVDQTRALLGS